MTHTAPLSDRIRTQDPRAYTVQVRRAGTQAQALSQAMGYHWGLVDDAELLAALEAR
jgi:hypothetical protein